MHYVLDTDICSYLIKGNCPVLVQNLDDRCGDKISVTAITCAELLFGAEKKGSQKIKDKIEAIVSKANVIAFGEYAAIEYSKMRFELEESGISIGNMDMLIASCVLAEDAILVTNNEKHFSRIKGLRIENWTFSRK
jgi:tRNA(fMet)-specific endonuclease VapC